MSVSDVLPVDPSYVVPMNLQQIVLVTPFDSGQEQRKLKQSNPKRQFRISSKNLNDTELKSLFDFYIARKGAFDIFSYLPPTHLHRLKTAIACGTGDGAKTVFDIGNTLTPPYYYRVYLGAGNRNQAYEDATPVTGVFANNDTTKLSTVTITPAPASPKVITVDIDRHFIMRFSDNPLRAGLIAFSTADADFDLIEVFRDSI